jgi:hypothetical protein
MIRHVITIVLAVPLGFAQLHAVGAQEQTGNAAQDLQAFVGAPATTFTSAEELAENLKAALISGDKPVLAALLGLSPEEVQKSEEVETALPRLKEAAAEAVAVKDIGDDRSLILLGDEVWPFPFPAVKVDGRWSFDTIDGLEEVINRRIGENELTAIANMRGFVDAQEEYRQTDWDEDGVTEYAQKLISSRGTYDGLYWAPGDGVPDSPVGGLVDEAEISSAKKDGYFGYRYRILTGQGANVAGGQYSYIINDHMIAGFALIATPAQYDRTGLMSFIVNQYGTVYEKDLGKDSTALAEKITAFDPDDSWSVVSDPGD